MPTDITQSDITVTIPSLGDSANIVTAFTDYHTDLAAAVAVLGRSTNTFTGDIALNGGDITTTSSTFNVANTNALTVQIGLAATSLVFGATTGQTAFRNDIVLGAGKRIILEGATNDTAETVLTVADPTTDRTITFPDASGNVVLDTATQTLTNKTLTTPIISSISNSGTVTLPTGTRTLVARDTTDTLTNKTVTGLVLTAGTNSLAPLRLSGTSLLTTDLDGAVEYNGQFFLTNNTRTKRGVVSPRHVYSLTSTRSLSTTAGTNSIFGASLALEANTVYEFEISFAITLTCGVSTNSNFTLSTALPTSSTVSYHSQHSSGITSTGPLETFATGAAAPATTAALNFSGTSTPLAAQYRMRGIIRTSSTEGDFTPNFVLANSGGVPTSIVLSAGSYVTVNKIGASNANIVTGAWT
jgi:hypothetical protein